MLKTPDRWKTFEELTDGIDENHYLNLYITGVMEEFERLQIDHPSYEQQQAIRQHIKAKFREVLNAAYREGWSDHLAAIEPYTIGCRAPMATEFHADQDSDWNKRFEPVKS